MQTKKLKRQSGITLVALVVTIIVHIAKIKGLKAFCIL